MIIWVLRLIRHLQRLGRPLSASAILARSGNRAAFLFETFAASGGHLAVAAAMLPGRQYRTGRLAFLICRALDALEDLSGNRAQAAREMALFLSYLSGNADRTPTRTAIKPVRETDRLEQAILKGSRHLRQELESQDEKTRARILLLARSIAQSMLRFYESRQNRDHKLAGDYAEAVLGETVRFSFELIEQSDRYVDVGAVGRLNQAANDLRDLDTDRLGTHLNDHAYRQMQLQLQLLEAAPQLPMLLESFRFPAFSRARGATWFFAAVTARFCERNVGARMEPSLALRHPLLRALLAMLQPRALQCLACDVWHIMLTVCSDVSFVTAETRFERAKKSAPVDIRRRRERLQHRYERALVTATQPEQAGLRILRAITLARLAGELLDTLPDVFVQRKADAAAGTVMLCDHLVSAALVEIAMLDRNIIGGFARLLSALCIKGFDLARPDRDGSEIAAFITGLCDANRTKARTSQVFSQTLYQLDNRDATLPVVMKRLSLGRRIERMSA